MSVLRCTNIYIYGIRYNNTDRKKTKIQTRIRELLLFHIIDQLIKKQTFLCLSIKRKQIKRKLSYVYNFYVDTFCVLQFFMASAWS